MLITVLKLGETLRINDDIRLIINDVNEKKKSAKLGVDAPKNIIVDRAEVRNKRIANPAYEKAKDSIKES